MKEWIISGDVITTVLVFFALEIVVLTAVRRRRESGLTLARLLSLIAPGLFIFLALRAALVGGTWIEIAAWLVLSLVAHIRDVWLRWHECVPSSEDLP